MVSGMREREEDGAECCVGLLGGGRSHAGREEEGFAWLRCGVADPLSPAKMNGGLDVGQSGSGWVWRVGGGERCVAESVDGVGRQPESW